ncbi:MAG: HD domain-containing protein [Fusobacteriaceae bacterium]
MELKKQLDFLIEIDKIKGILRQSLVLNGERQENDAEHSWHMAMTAFTLKAYFHYSIDMEKTLKMILIHDIVEIYAGDNPCFGIINPKKYYQELESSKKIFGLLPKKQGKELMNLWLEFEEKKTSESIFANCCDIFQGFLQNLTSNGHTWKKYHVKEEQVLKRVKLIKDYLPQVYKEIILKEIEYYKKKMIIQF